MLNYRYVLEVLDKSFKPNFDEEKPTNLLCLSVSDEYLAADIKVMVFGQETNDWHGEYGGAQEAESLVEEYDVFFTSKKCFNYGGHFWNAVSKTVDTLQDKTGKSVGLLWNNIVKIGKSGGKGRPVMEVIEWQQPAMKLILQEIEFAKPDIVIFFTGPDYDDMLHRVFEDIQFKRASEKTVRQLAQVSSKHLPAKSVRTYHPGYLWRNDFQDYLNDILAVVLSKADSE
jgi:hypothetical protein